MECCTNLGGMELFGSLIESLVIRDLRVYAQAADAEVFDDRVKFTLPPRRPCGDRVPALSNPVRFRKAWKPFATGGASQAAAPASCRS